jgi:hypothetical protein
VKNKPADGRAAAFGGGTDAASFVERAAEKKSGSGSREASGPMKRELGQAQIVDLVREGFLEGDGAHDDVQDVTTHGATLKLGAIANGGGLRRRTID